MPVLDHTPPSPEAPVEAGVGTSGQRYALLVHGLFGDSASWYRLVPALVDRGYLVHRIRWGGRTG